MNMIKYGLVGIGLLLMVLIFSNFVSENPDPAKNEHFVTMSVTEVYKENLVSEILVCYGDHHTKSIPLKKYHKDNRASNLEKVTIALNELHAEGYKIITSSIAVTNHHQKKLFILEKY